MAGKDTFKPTEADDEELDSFHSSLWKMPTLSQSIPSIEINEQAVNLNDLDPSKTDPVDSSTTKTDASSAQESASSGATFETDRKGSSSSSTEPILHEKLVRDDKSDADSGIHHHLKLWRRKLMVLIWLNFLMRFRKRFTTGVELTFPLMCLAVVCSGAVYNNSWTKQLTDDYTQIPEDSPFVATNEMVKESLYSYVCSNDRLCDEQHTREYFIVYSPNNSDFVNNLMQDVRNILDLNHVLNSSAFFGVASSAEVNKSCEERFRDPDNLGNARYPYGVIFSVNEKESDHKVPKKLKYRIRTYFPEIANTAENFPFVERTYAPRSRHSVSPYIFTGFSGLQLAIDLAYINLAKEEIILENIPPDNKRISIDMTVKDLYESYIKSPSVRMFNYPFFLERDACYRAWIVIMMTFVLSYLLTNFVVVQGICSEAKIGRFELLKLHGLTPALHWISYIINTAFLRLITTGFMSVIMYYSFRYHAMIDYKNPFIMWLFLFLHAVAQNCENYFFAHFFDSPTVGGMAYLLKSMITVLVPVLLFTSDVIPRWLNLGFCLLVPQWCLANGLFSYMQYELYEEANDWFDFSILVDPDNFKIIPTQICCILFIYSIAVYIVLTIYVDKVFSKTFSPGISWYYFLKGCRNKEKEYQKPTQPINYADMPKMFEKPASDLVTTVRVRNICHTFESESSYEISLDNISLDFHESEISIICGPGGSGKTNLLHLIGGLIKPTSGYIELKNLKVHENSAYLNQFISIVPQRSMLFPTLSTEDHIRLCCMIHGISYRKSKTQAKLLLQLFNLTPFKRHSSAWLSESDRKNLALAMALASMPTVILLDEPCQGMDAQSAKDFWKYIQVLKTKRTVIITTSRLEDVELYADRIAILAQGKLLCFGTPNRIKKFYDLGSVLNLKEDANAGSIDEERAQMMVNAEVKGAIFLGYTGYETNRLNLRFLLPFGQPYAALLEKLEDEQENLRFSKVYVSRVELDTLFYKISLSKGIESIIAARKTFLTKELSKGKSNIENVKELTANIPNFPRSNLKPTTFGHFYALYTKKFIYVRQKHNFFLTEFLIPMLLVILIFLFSHEFLKFQPESLARTLHLGMYNNTHTLIRSASSLAHNEAWFEAYAKVLPHTERLFADETMLGEIFKRRNHSLTNYRQQVIIGIDLDDSTIGYYSSNSFHSCPIVLNTMANAFLSIISPDDTNRYQISISNHPIHPYEGFPAGSTHSNSTTIFALLVSIVLTLIAAAKLPLPLLEKQNGMKTLQLSIGVHPTIYWLANASGDFLISCAVTVLFMGIICILDILIHQISGKEERYAIAAIVFVYLCWTSPPYVYLLSRLLVSEHNGYSHFLVLHFLLGIFPKVVTYQIFRTATGTETLLSTVITYARYVFHVFPPYSMTSALVHYFHILTERSYCNDAHSYKELCDAFKHLQEGDTITQYLADKLSLAEDFDSKFRCCCTEFCTRENICHPKRNFWAPAPIPGFLIDMIAMSIQGLIYWVLVLCMEHNVPQGCFYFVFSKIFGSRELKAADSDTRDIEESEDVKNEHNKVDYMIDIEDDVDTEVFLVQDVSKFFSHVKIIDHAYFSIPINQITGILGLSKSGLTTLVHLLNGRINRTSGTMFIHNELLTTNNKVALTSGIGFCTQGNTYYPELTGFQMLQLIARLRGIPELQIDIQVTRWLEVFDLEPLAHLRCKSYRLGAVRRLCCAMAMIGNPEVVIFDEPTFDMDVGEKHIFWKAVKKSNCLGQTIIFTSYFADEMEQTANKVLILQHGTVVAVGGISDVFEINTRGYLLAVRCRVQAFKNLDAYQRNLKIDQLRDHINQHLSPCELLVEEGMILVYHLRDLTMKLSYAYGIVEGAREKFPNLIDNFHVAEPTLDEVVLNYHRIKQVKLHKDKDGERERASDDVDGPK